MAEVGPGLGQYLGRFTGADQQVGAGLTTPHPLYAAGQPLTDRRVGRVYFRAPSSNTADCTVTNQAAATAGQKVQTLVPGAEYEAVAYNPGERYRLGTFYINTTGTDYVEVWYTKR